MTRCCADDVSGEHQQGLADAVRSVESAAAPMYSEVRILVRKYLWFACPKGMRYLQPMSGVGIEFARLDEEGEKCGDKQEQGNRIRKCASGMFPSYREQWLASLY